MKQNKFFYFILILVCTLNLACGSGGGGSGDTDEKTSVTTTEDKYRSPLPTDILPASSGSSTWYSFENDNYGLCLTGMTFTFDSDSFEELYYYWNGKSWEKYLGMKGSLSSVSSTEYTAVLEAIYMPGDTGMGWYNSTTAEFDNYCTYVWSPSGFTVNVLFSETSDTLTYKRDTTGDGLYTGSDDFSSTMNKTAYTTLKGHGIYPLNQWRSWSFHGHADQASSSIQMDSSVDAADVQSITGKAKDQNGNTYGPFTYTWVSGDEEWETTYTFTDPSSGGIWWLSEINIVLKNGSSAVYTAADPWSNYKVTYVTDTGYVSPVAAACDFSAGQDYMPPNDAGTGNTFYYVRTIPNASCDLAPDKSDYTDTTIYLYSSDTSKWIAKNDDWDDFNRGYSAIKYPFENGATYYVKVVDLNNNTRAYSIVFQTDYTASKSTETVTLASDDLYEQDDTPATAKTITLDAAAQDRVYTSGDPDWIKIVIP